MKKIINMNVNRKIMSKKNLPKHKYEYKQKRWQQEENKYKIYNYKF